MTRFQAKNICSAAVDTLNAKSSEVLLLMFDLTSRSLISSECHQ
jgi:hypothetical protein